MKSAIVLFITLVIFTPVKGQNDPSLIQKVKFGLAAGINYTKSPTLSYEEVVPNYYVYKRSKYAPGFAARLFMEYYSSKVLSVQPEIGYVYYHQKQVYSASPHNADDADRYTDDFHIGAFTLATMFKYSTRYITIQTGPQLDFPVSAKINNLSRIIGSLGPSERSSEEDMKKEKKIITPVFNWIFGVEHTIRERFRIQANYQLGLSSYTKTHILWKISKASGFYLGGAYRF